MEGIDVGIPLAEGLGAVQEHAEVLGNIGAQLIPVLGELVALLAGEVGAHGVEIGGIIVLVQPVRPVGDGGAGLVALLVEELGLGIRQGGIHKGVHGVNEGQPGEGLALGVVQGPIGVVPLRQNKEGTTRRFILN